MTSTDSKIDTSGAEDNLFLIDSGKPREIHVSIAQEDYPQARHCVSQPVHVRMGTRPAIPRLVRVNQRANLRLRNQALAASNDGDLAVIADDDRKSEQDYQLANIDSTALLCCRTTSVSWKPANTATCPSCPPRPDWPADVARHQNTRIASHGLLLTDVDSSTILCTLNSARLFTRGSPSAERTATILHMAQNDTLLPRSLLYEL